MQLPSVKFALLPEKERLSCRCLRNGLDTVEFMLSANPGEPQTACQGGQWREARIMLALKNIAANLDGMTVDF
ncbi:MAG: hypothetical protein ACLUO4_06855 [Christensenellales bacterium]